MNIKGGFFVGKRRWLCALMALLLMCAMGCVALAEPEELEAPVEEQVLELGEFELIEEPQEFIIGSDPVEAELALDPETCPHANTETRRGRFNDWEDADPRESYTITSVDNTSHKITGYCYTVTHCRDCDTDINPPVRDTKKTTWTEGHDYDENETCRVCGHVNTCNHPRMERDEGPRNWEDDAEPHEEYQVVSLNHHEHQITGHKYTWYYCPDCDNTYDLTREDEVTKWTQGHWYNGGTVCEFELCGHVNDCQHLHAEHNEGAYNWWNGEKYTVKSANEREHKITGAWYTWDYCPDCDQDINIEKGAKKTWKEHHHYGDDLVCHFELCNHVNACKHKHVEHNEGIYYWWEDAEPQEQYTVVSLNDAVHKITGHRYTWNWCKDCDCDVDIYRDPSSTTWTEGHWYNEDGVCDFDLCGHVNTCQHPHVEHNEGAYRWWDGEKYTVKSINEREHRITGPLYTWDHCPDCDTDFNVRKGAKKTWTEHHHYGEDLVCHFELCNHVNACKHKNREYNEGAYYWWDDAENQGTYTVVSLNDAEHEITGRKYTWYWCPDCECDFDITPSDGITTWKDGHWYNEKGVCEFEPCGHVNACTHENLEPREGSRPWEGGYKSIKAVNYIEHKTKGPYYTWDWCPDCHQDLNIVSHGVQTFTERHDYDESLSVPVCRWCGKKMDCPHKKAEADGGIFLGERDLDDYVIESLGAVGHHVEGDYFTWKYCPDCEQFLDVQLEGHKTFDADHWYNHQGVCNLCGYQCENVYELKASGSTPMNKGDILFLALGSNTGTSFKSSKTSVVDTDGPIMFAKETGTATVTVKLSTGKSLKLKITVVDPKAPKKLVIEAPASKKVNMTDTPTLTLKTTITPDTASDAKVIWDSKNEKRATVDQNGVVTFHDKGSVTITATTIGEKNKKITGKITFTVTK